MAGGGRRVSPYRQSSPMLVQATLITMDHSQGSSRVLLGIVVWWEAEVNKVE